MQAARGHQVHLLARRLHAVAQLEGRIDVDTQGQDYIGGTGQEKLCAATVRLDPDSIAARYLAAGGTTISKDGEPPCPACLLELGEDDPLLALSVQQRILQGHCPRHR